MKNKVLGYINKDFKLSDLLLISLFAFVGWILLEWLVWTVFTNGDYTAYKLFEEYFITKDLKHMKVTTFLLFLLWPILLYALKDAYKNKLIALLLISVILPVVIESLLSRALGINPVAFYLLVGVSILLITDEKYFILLLLFVAYIAFVLVGKGVFLVSSYSLATKDSIMMTIVNYFSYYLPILWYLTWISRRMFNGDPILNE